MFEKLNKVFETKEVAAEPYINVPSANTYKGINDSNISDKKVSMDYAKRQPIIIGIGNVLVNDIFTRVSFKSIADSSKGRPKKNDLAPNIAMEFYKKNFVKQIYKEAGYDWVFTGEGFIWHGGIDKKKIKEIMYKIIPDKEDIVIDGVVMTKHVASTTMTPKYTDKNIIRFDQQVSAKETKSWTPENIIHLKFMPLDGKPSGFSPMFSGKPVVETLGLIMDYAGEFFEGGGAPEMAFIFPEETQNSETFKKTKAEIKKFYDTKRRGHLFLAGKMDKEIINDWNKDMEFRDLFVLYTGIAAFMYGMPLHRIQSILGGDMKSSSGSSDLSDSGYWRFIYESQDYWENKLNVDFWNPYFGVDIQFSRSYLQDTERETQATSTSLSNIQMLEDLDLIKPECKKDVYAQLLTMVPNEAINPNPKPKEKVPNNNSLPNKDLMRGQATKKLSDEKKDQAGKTEAEKKGM